MEQNANQKNQIPAPKKRMSDFRKGLLWTAIPIIVCSVISSSGLGAQNHWVGFQVFSYLVSVLWVLAILTCIGFAVAHKRQVALGVLAGIGIGIVGLGVTCFATINYTV